MRRRYLLVALTSLAMASSVGREARADDPDGAKKHFEVGRKLRDDGDCTKAIGEFQASVAADKSIGAYYNLGFCQEQLGRRQDAYAAYRNARDMASTRKDDRLKEVSGAIAALMETPNIRLLLPQPLPAGFQLFVDGDLVPAALYETETVYFTKSAATHDVKVLAPGYQDVALKLETKGIKPVELKPGTSSATPPTTTTPPTTPPPPAEPRSRPRP